MAHAAVGRQAGHRYPKVEGSGLGRGHNQFRWFDDNSPLSLIAADDRGQRPHTPILFADDAFNHQPAL